MTQVIFEGNTVEVTRMLVSLESATNPVAIAGFLNTVVDPYLRDRARMRFEDEGDSAVGGKWKPLSSATQEIRDNMGYGAAHPINVRTGELESYIVDSPNKVSVFPGGASLTLPGQPAGGELLEKYITAQQGSAGQNNFSGTPPRPVLALDVKDLMFVVWALGDSIRRSVGARMI